NAFHILRPVLSHVEQAENDVQNDTLPSGEASTDKIPVIKATTQSDPTDTSGADQNAPAQNEDVAQLETAHIPAAALPSDTPEDVVQLEFPDIPIAMPSVAQLAFPAEANDESEVAQLAFPAEVSDLSEGTFSDEAGVTKDEVASEDDKGEDVTRLETAHIPVAGISEVETSEIPAVD